MYKMDLWLIKFWEMTTGRYIIRRVKIGARLAVLLCTAHVSNADIQVGFEAAKCVNPLPAYTGRRLTVNGENRPKHRPFYRRKQLANRQAFPLNWHTIPASALVTSMVYIPSARAEEAGPEGQCQHGCEYQTMPIFTPRFSFSLGFVFPRNTNGAAAMTAVSSATSSTSR